MAKEEKFKEVANYWDLKTLYNDLASAKGKHLTPVEKTHLRGLLSGFSPQEIAEKLHKDINGVETDLCTSIYRYVKSLTGKNNQKVDNWRSICEWLTEAGYKYQGYSQISASDLPENSVVNITNITFDKTKISIGVNLQITIPIPPEIDLKNSDIDKNIN